MKKIYFNIIFETNLKRKFDKFISDYSQEIKYDFKNLKTIRHQSEQDQFQANFHIESAIANKELIIFEILKLANKLCDTGYGNWSIKGFNEIEDKLSFECTLDNKNDDQPLKWANIKFNSNG